jgi:hypothetical protein
MDRRRGIRTGIEDKVKLAILNLNWIFGFLKVCRARFIFIVGADGLTHHFQSTMGGCSGSAF